jgi:hypothetical protein
MVLVLFLLGVRNFLLGTFLGEVGNGPRGEVTYNLRYSLVAGDIVEHVNLESFDFLALMVNYKVFLLNYLVKVFDVSLLEHLLIL